MQRTTVNTAEGTWDQRLDPGVDVRSVPLETRSLLAQALGTLGVEAEYSLALVRPFTSDTITSPPATRAEGERFLWQLDAWARRFITTAESLEIATQAYLASLERADPALLASADEQAHPWWPDLNVSPLPGGSLEMTLRRCGFAYRHVATAHIADHVQAVGEQMALVLHALNTLPPAGVLPLSNLHAGLYELAETIQGDIVLRHLRDVSAEHPGLITGIARLRQLDATEDRSVNADVTWARGQLAELARLSAELAGSSGATPSPPPRRGLSALFRRGPITQSVALGSTGAAAFLARAQRDWNDTIAALEALRAPARDHPAQAWR